MQPQSTLIYMMCTQHDPVVRVHFLVVPTWLVASNNLAFCLLTLCWHQDPSPSWYPLLDFAHPGYPVEQATGCPCIWAEKTHLEVHLRQIKSAWMASCKNCTLKQMKFSV